ncbi:MAG: hypothetical protein ACOYK3_03155 [Flavobacterium sp.]|jgi:hypothetical protein
MIISLKKLLFRYVKNTPKVNDTGTTSPIDNSITTVKTASENSFLLVLKPTFSESFFGIFQKKNNSLFKLIELGHYQRFKTTTLGVLALELFFVVVQVRDRGGHGSSIIRKNRDYDSFLAKSLLDINNY